MEEMLTYISDFGLSLVIAGLFIWDWIANKKENRSSLRSIAKSMELVEDCMGEIKISNTNISKSLNILQTSVDNTSNKLDILLDRDRK